MSAAFVQRAPNTTLPSEFTGVSSGAVTFGSTPGAGNLVTVACAGNNGTLRSVSTVADNKGNGNYASAVHNDDGSAKNADIYYKENIATGASFQVTVTMSGTCDFSVGLAEWSGTATSSSLGPTNVGGATNAAATTNSMNPSAPAVYVGVMTAIGMSALAPDQTEIHTEPSSSITAMGHEYTLGSGSQSLTWTNTSVAWIACGATFLEPALVTTSIRNPVTRPALFRPGLAR